MTVRAIALLIALALAAGILAVPAAAEEFRVIWCFRGVFDSSKVEIEQPLNINLSNVRNEKLKAVLISNIVINRTMKEADRSVRIVYKIISVDYRAGEWYIRYQWDYPGNLEAGSKPARTFDVRINMKTRMIAHSRNTEDQYSGPPPKAVK